MMTQRRPPKSFDNFFTGEPRDGYGEPTQSSAQPADFECDAPLGEAEEVVTPLAA